MKILYVDDLRSPINQSKEQIYVARSFKKAINYLKNNKFDIIDLDHDLGEEKTGYDICKFIIENRIEIPIIQIHTANVVGKFNMKQLLERYTKSKIIIK